MSRQITRRHAASTLATLLAVPSLARAVVDNPALEAAAYDEGALTWYTAQVDAQTAFRLYLGLELSAKGWDEMAFFALHCPLPPRRAATWTEFQRTRIRRQFTGWKIIRRWAQFIFSRYPRLFQIGLDGQLRGNVSASIKLPNGDSKSRALVLTGKVNAPTLMVP